MLEAIAEKPRKSKRPMGLTKANEPLRLPALRLNRRAAINMAVAPIMVAMPDDGHQWTGNAEVQGQRPRARERPPSSCCTSPWPISWIW